VAASRSQLLSQPDARTVQFLSDPANEYRLCKRACCLHREWPWSNDWHYYSLEFETGPNPNANVAMMIR
jgi:hypothetical protein